MEYRGTYEWETWKNCPIPEAVCYSGQSVGLDQKALVQFPHSSMKFTGWPWQVAYLILTYLKCNHESKMEQSHECCPEEE